MSAPKASIVIPSYFHDAYIEEAVDSCLTQSHRNIELIVVDDGSKDRSRLILNRIRDRRFTLIEQANAGAHAAINKGLESASGDYLAILNSDDVFAPHRLSALIDCARSTDAPLVASWLQQINAGGNRGAVKKGWTNQLPNWAGADQSEPDTSDPFLYHLCRSNFVSTTSNMLFTRAVYERVGGMRNLRFAHDWDFAFRVAITGRCALLPETSLYYRTHATNTIRSNDDWMMFEILWILAMHLPKVAERFATLGEAHKVHDVAPALISGRYADAFSEINRAIRDEARAVDDERACGLLDDADARQPFVSLIAAM